MLTGYELWAAIWQTFLENCIRRNQERRVRRAYHGRLFADVVRSSFWALAFMLVAGQAHAEGLPWWHRVIQANAAGAPMADVWTTLSNNTIILSPELNPLRQLQEGNRLLRTQDGRSEPVRLLVLKGGEMAFTQWLLHEVNAKARPMPARIAVYAGVILWNGLEWRIAASNYRLHQQYAR